MFIPTPVGKRVEHRLIAIPALFFGVLILRAMLGDWNTSSLIGASPQENIPYVVPLENGKGQITVIPPSRWTLWVQFVVEMHGLQNKGYELSLEGEDGSPIVLGQGNLSVFYGRRETDTVVAPHEGGILAWYISHERFVAGRSARIVLRGREEHNVVAQSALFQGPPSRHGNLY